MTAHPRQGRPQTQVAVQPGCPRPDKVAHATKRDAKQALQAIRCTDRGSLEAYRCECGAWHTGRKRPKQQAA